MKIKFIPTGQEIEANPNKNLLQICGENGVEIKSICKGVPSCAECRVKIVEGEHNLIPPTKAEIALIGSNYYIDQRRLACQVRCFGNITVDIQEQIERAEFQSKKVRGFRTPGQKGSNVTTTAKQGTLVLEEGGAVKATPEQNQNRGGGGGRSQGGNNHQNNRGNKNGPHKNQGRR